MRSSCGSQWADSLSKATSTFEADMGENTDDLYMELTRRPAVIAMRIASLMASSL